MTNSHLPKHLIKLVSSILFLLFIVSPGITQDTPTFRIGVIDTPEGSLTKGAILAATLINGEGGIEGADGTIFEIEIVATAPDDEGEIATAISNIQQASVVAVLGPVTTEQVLDNLSDLQNIGVPVITPAIGDTILASDSRDVLLRSRAAEVLHGRALAEFLVNDLQVDTLAVVQLDIASTAGVVGFTTAASALNVSSQRSILFQTGMELEELIDDILQANAQATVIYGPPELSGQVFTEMRASGYAGFVGYNLASSDEFQNAVPTDLLSGIIRANSWSTSLNEPVSTGFLVEYTRAFAEIPDAIAAAAYDSVFVIAEALGEPGELRQNLLEIDEFMGAQGELHPADLLDGEISDNVVVTILNEYGGEDVVARFEGGVRVIGDDDFVVAPVIVRATPTPTASPTLDGVYARVISDVLNVRSGPGLNYDIIGRLNEGEVVRIIGANVDFSWAVIEFRLQQAWISTQPNLVEILGDRRTVPVVAAPPTPTAAPPTETAVPSDIADIIVQSANPTNIPFNTPTTVDVTIRNVGGQNAGAFAVATSFEPNNVYAAQNINSLAAGTSLTFQLAMPAISQTGNFEALIIADLNSQINEGPVGEANNQYSYFYKVDRPSLTNATTLGTGASLDIDGGGADIIFTASGLETVGGCVPPISCIGLLSPALTWETAHYDAISSANGINANSVLNVSLAPGTTIGVLTNQGNRAVIRVDSVTPGSAITFTYRFY